MIETQLEPKGNSLMERDLVSGKDPMKKRQLAHTKKLRLLVSRVRNLGKEACFNRLP